MRRRVGPLLPSVLAFLFFAAAAVVFTWPLAARMRSGMPDMWDDKLNAWIFHWDFHQLFRDPLHLFDTNIFFPARYTLAFSENLFGAAVFGFPLYAAGASTLFTANVLMLLGMALSGLAAWALAREVTGDAVASVLAGVVYAFVPWRIAQLPHVQFQWGAFLALLLLFLLRAFAGGRRWRRDAILFGVFFAWNALTNVHYTLFSGLLVLLVVFHAALTLETAVFLRRAAAIAAAGAIACVVALPFYVPYVRASQQYGMVRGEGEIETYSGRAIDFMTAGPQNKLYAPLTQKWGHGEGDFFPGLAPLALAAFGWARLRRRGGAGGRPLEENEAGPPAVSRARRGWARVLDVLAAAGVASAAAVWLFHRQTLGPVRLRDPSRVLVVVTALVFVRLVLAFPRRSRYLSLGDFVRRAPAGPRAILFAWIAALGVMVALGVHTPYYRFLVQSMGSIFRSIRVPGRGIVLFDLGLAVLAAWGLSLATAARSPRFRRLATAAALAVVAFEYRAFPIDIAPIPERAAPVYEWAASLALPPETALVEWPLGFDVDAEHVFRSTSHWKPLVNGYSGFAPPHYDRLHTALELEPPAIPDSVWKAMRDLGAAVLLFHPTEVRDDAIRRYAAALGSGLRSGAIRPVARFSRPGGEEGLDDLAFLLAGSPSFATEVPAANAMTSVTDALGLVDRIVARRTAPFGEVDRPRDGEEVRAGSWAFGWALDDSGIASVRISAEGDGAPPPAECAVHTPFPGVDAVYGRYPEAKSPGFGCAVPRVAPGERVLVFELVARDGGSTRLLRKVRVRP